RQLPRRFVASGAHSTSVDEAFGNMTSLPRLLSFVVVKENNAPAAAPPMASPKTTVYVVAASKGCEGRRNRSLPPSANVSLALTAVSLLSKVAASFLIGAGSAFEKRRPTIVLTSTSVAPFCGTDPARNTGAGCSSSDIVVKLKPSLSALKSSLLSI